MTNFTHDEKCAMIIAISHIGTIDDSRKEARTRIMLRYQDMLGIDNFEMWEYANSKKDEIFPTLQTMSIEKKKLFVQMMFQLMYEDRQIVDSELQAFVRLIKTCNIPDDIAKEAIQEATGRTL